MATFPETIMLEKSPSNFPVSLRLGAALCTASSSMGVIYTVSSVPRVTVTPSVLCTPAWYMIVSLPAYLLYYIAEFLTVPSVLAGTSPVCFLQLKSPGLVLEV